MATRKSGSDTPKTERRSKPRATTSAKTTTAPRKRATKKDIVEEAQNFGADVVPEGAIEVSASARSSVPGARQEEPNTEISNFEFRISNEEPGTEASPTQPPAESEFRNPKFEIQAASPAAAHHPPPTTQQLLSDWDLHLFNEGTHRTLWQKLGSHIVPGGVIFGVWAPNAAKVSVMGDFNGWNPQSHPLQARGSSGLWEGFVPRIGKGTHYKYHIASRVNDYEVDKADPVGIHHETPPRTASIVWDLDYDWNDTAWMKSRPDHNSFSSPMSIYEVHLGSWMRVYEDGVYRMPSFREVAQRLAEYVKKMNFTHVELLPIMEHPFYGSWGYQTTGYFAPSSRYGTPQDFKYFVDVLHQNGIGVILDWVPSHFPTDEHGLSFFDGTHLYEHADPRKGFHPDWKSFIFNYGRNEVRSFLLSSALYWLDEYHADGLRVDAVASMLYLDYSRKAGEWIPNEFGGRENVDAISFLRRMNQDAYEVHPDVQVIAEESTAWPMVSRPLYVGGLGFGMKWDMGWMHDSLRYFSKDPVHRRFHHNDLTFRMMYAFTENFVLPLSHDEIVHGKGSLIGKMPGDDWQKFANLRLLFAHMYSQPAKKMIFMGGEFGQWREWNHDQSLDWNLLDFPNHDALRRWVEDLNKAYRDIPALHELDLEPAGFEWIDCCDTEQSVLSLLRRSRSKPDEFIVAALNFTPMPRYNYRIGVPAPGHWREVLNSDAPIYGGSGQGNMGGVDAVPIPLHGRKWSVTLTLPPLGAVFLLSQSSGGEIAIDESA
jgi:1,4-alpha-glucan branching enzyme